MTYQQLLPRIQEVRKWVLRKITTGANHIGRVPLSARYIANEAMDKGLLQ